MGSKRKNFLTILLIIIIVVIVGVIGYLGFELIEGKIKEKESKSITDEFDNQIPTITEDELAEELAQEQAEAEAQAQAQANQEGQGNNGGGNSNTGSSSGGRGNSYYGNNNYRYTTGVQIDGYWVVGTIRIPATGIKYSVFSKPTKAALERGTGMLYTSNGINQPGNTVIAGHNYRNRLFFSKNKNLVVGNLIYVKDVTGIEVTYAVTQKFTTNSSDTSFYQRDTGGKREITLTTCTDNGSNTGERLIILAREQ